MAGINFVRRWVMGQMKKTSDDGIMITLPNKNKVDLNVSITMDRLIRNGIDPDQITSPQQVENALNMIDSRMASRAIPADSAEGREITEKIFGKQKAPVFDLEGNRIPEGSGIMGGKAVKELMESGQVSKGARGMKKSKKVQDREMFQAANERLTSDVDSIINNIKSMEPIPAMKEANSVIGRKGKYKNLTPEQSKKILQDTEDHIFERDIPEEDFATGGRAGYKSGNSVLDQALAVASVPYNFAKGMVGNVSNPGAVTDVSLTGAQTDFLDSIAKSKGPSGTIDYSDYGGPTKTFSGIGDMNPMQASLATTMGGTSYSTNPDGSINYTGGAYDFNKGNVVTDFIDKGGILGAVDRLGDGAIGKVGASIYDAVNPEEDYDFSEIEGQTAGLGVLTGLNKLFGPKIGAAIFRAGKNKTNSYIGKNIVKPGIDKAIKKIKDRKITTKSTGGGGPNIISGGGGDRDFSVKGPDTSANPTGKSNQASAARGYALHGADGGRAAFMAGGMGRRGFLKMLAGLGGGIAAAKTGLLKFAGKEPAKQVAKEVAKEVTSTYPPPYFFKLAEKIKFMGDDTLATTDKAIAKKYKDYTMEEDFAGNIEIIKKGDNVAEDVFMSYKVDDVPLRGKKGSKRVQEYEEYTARPDAEGKMKDIEQGVPDEVIDEAGDTTAMTLKKASGGIARMLGE